MTWLCTELPVSLASAVCISIDRYPVHPGLCSTSLQSGPRLYEGSFLKLCLLASQDQPALLEIFFSTPSVHFLSLGAESTLILPALDGSRNFGRAPQLQGTGPALGVGPCLCLFPFMFISAASCVQAPCLL